jgi:hypothetical protein
MQLLICPTKQMQSTTLLKSLSAILREDWKKVVIHFRLERIYPKNGHAIRRFLCIGKIGGYRRF